MVVIVHGSQEINAMATIIWDCAFSEPVSNTEQPHNSSFGVLLSTLFNVLTNRQHVPCVVLNSEQDTVRHSGACALEADV